MKNVSIDVNYNLIQNIRLAQALSDIDIGFVVAESNRSKFLNLQNMSDIRFADKNDDLLFIDSIHISHEKPSISLLGIEKPLIFPINFINYLKLKWGKRENEYFFSGLLTSSRQKTIEHWLGEQNINYNKVELLKLKFCQKLPLSIRSRFLKKINCIFGDLVLSDSIRGRAFPYKSLDMDYYNEMLNSKFVLCPNGDFIWTYRFFEAILCGAIPIVEDECELYSGFKFYKMNQNKSEYIWDKDIIEFNLNKCIQTICLTPENIIHLKKSLNQ